MKNFKFKILSLIVLASVVLSGCSARVIENKEGRRATVRDAIYSLEPRANGAYVMWLRYDDEGVYCIDSDTLYNQAMNLLLTTGWAIVEYHTYSSVNDVGRCSDVENTTSDAGTKHTIYVVNSIKTAE